MANNESPLHHPDAETGRAGAHAFDTGRAHQARMYDYFLGGKDHYPADREAAEAWLKMDPKAAFSSRANRAFLGRAVRYLAGEAGMRQFLDIGTGIPTSGNTHEVAQAVAPKSRVVYVDYDPVVLAHARALLTSNGAGATEYIDADLRDTATILGQARKLLDFTRPVAVTLVAILHAIPDADDPYAIVATLMDAVPSGSYLAVSHVGSDLFDTEALTGVSGLTDQVADWKFAARDRAGVTRFFDGLDLVEPGLVRVEDWRADSGTAAEGTSTVYGAVARKR
jgi:hypothetical protein